MSNVIKSKIMECIEERNDVNDEELYELIDDAIHEEGKNTFLTLKERMILRKGLFNSFRKLDVLQEIIDDEEITEIMINNQDNIFIEKHGKIERWNKKFESHKQLEDMIQQIVSRVNRRVNISNPIVDARLEDGSRVHIVLPPIALDGAVVTIRKFPEPITIKKLISVGSISEECAEFLKLLIKAKYNIFISGGTGSGKTTFLNALSSYIADDERVITIEDSAELQIQHVKNLVRLETRNANGEGEGAVTISDLIRASLRMNPDRIIVGEVRGAEALDMLQAMNTGHDGSLSTGHANSAKDMLSRLETMVLMGAELPLEAIRGQIGSAIDIIIHLGRIRDKTRKVISIAEVGEYENGEIKLNTLYSFRENKEQGRKTKVSGNLTKVGNLISTQKLSAAGYRLQDIYSDMV